MISHVPGSGRYVCANQTKIQERAENTNDPRSVFYQAMLKNNSYDAYEKQVGTLEVLVETWHPPEIMSGNREMRYARNIRRWIRDA
jgi:hypothetical protein